MYLHMNGLSIGGHSSFLERLAKCGLKGVLQSINRFHSKNLLGGSYMSMCRPCDVFSTGTIFNRKHTLRNHFTRIRPDNMDTQDLVGLSFGQELDESLRVQICLCPRIGTEHELPNFVLDSFRLQVLFRLADPRNLRVGVDNGRDGIVIDVPVPGLDVLNRSDAFFFRLVGKHGTKRNIADAFDVLLRSGELIVDDDATSVVEFNARGFEIEAVRVWPSADGDKDDVSLQLKKHS
jgi:hypothetical protein